MPRVLVISLMLIVLAGCSQALKVDMGRTMTDTNVPPVDLSKAIARSNRENKMLLLEFGSSDSCPPCVAFQQNVFSSPEFQAYERSNLVFVRVDYPLKHELRPDTKATNEILLQQFDINPFPTFIALDRNGAEFWRLPPTNEDNPAIPRRLFDSKNFIDLLERVRKQAK